jgi:hypothetical protein
MWDVFVLGDGKRKVLNPNIEFDSSNDWQEHDEVALRGSLVGCHFFGHWLRDDCATLGGKACSGGKHAGPRLA